MFTHEEDEEDKLTKLPIGRLEYWNNFKNHYFQIILFYQIIYQAIRVGQIGEKFIFTSEYMWLGAKILLS